MHQTRRTPTPTGSNLLTGRRALLWNGVVALIVVIAIVSQRRSLSDSWSALQAADLRLLGLAMLLTAAGYAPAALSYTVLGWPKTSFRSALVVQAASGFANRIVPAGLGGLGLFAAYLHRCGYSIASASAIVVTNNILGAIGNLLLIGFVLLSHPYGTYSLHLPGRTTMAVAVVGLLLLCTLGMVTYHRYHQHMLRFVSSLSASLRPSYRSAVSLLCNLSLTSLNAVILCLCVWSLSGGLSWPEAILALSAGTVVGAVVPTPGGIGGVEAGLLAGLTASGVSPPSALAAVLLYRLLTYWFPALPGLLVLRQVRRRYI